jgi:hypothetical protein
VAPAILSPSIVEESTLSLGRAVELIDAATVSALVPMLVIENGVARDLSERELHTALFRDGGQEMHFADGRPPIATLAISRDAIARVLRILTGAAPRG